MKTIKYFILVLLKPFISFFENNSRIRQIRFELSESDKILLADTNNGNFLVNSSDRVIGLDSYSKKRSWDFNKFKLAYKLLGKHNHQILVDVGANIGSIAISALINNHFKRAIAIEPEPNNFFLLKSNSIINKIENRILLHNNALGQEETDNGTLSINSINHGDHVISNNKSYGNNVRVKISTLDSILPKCSAEDCLIWIDAQGYEVSILKGGKKAIKNMLPIVFEFSPNDISKKNRLQDLINIFEDSNYNTIIDLYDPKREMKPNKNSFSKLYQKYLKKNSFTDLFVLNR